MVKINTISYGCKEYFVADIPDVISGSNSRLLIGSQALNVVLYDEEKGYHTCSYLGRIAKTSDSFTDQENNEEIERAIDEIIQYDFLNVYK